MFNLTINQSLHNMAPTLAWLLIDATLKSAMLLLAAWMTTSLLRRGSAATRNRVWTLAFCGSLVFPAFSLMMPQYRVSADAFKLSSATVSESPASVPMEQQFDQVTLSHVDTTLETATVPDLLSEENAPDRTAIRLPELPTAPRETSNSSPIPAAARYAIDWVNLLLLAWATGCVVSTILFVVRAFASLRYLRSWPRMDDPIVTQCVQRISGQLRLSLEIRLLQADEKTIPMAFGILRPTVVIPSNWRDWPEAGLRFVMMHELAHIQRGDILFQTIARFSCAVYWCNPLVWYGLARMRMDCESACDDHVIGTGEAASDYADQLVQIARIYRPVQFAGGITMARSSKLQERIVSLLDTAKSHLPISRTASRILLSLAAGIVLTIGAIAVEKPAAEKDQPVAEAAVPPAADSPAAPPVTKAADAVADAVTDVAATEPSKAAADDFDEIEATIKMIQKLRAKSHAIVGKGLTGRGVGVLMAVRTNAGQSEAGIDHAKESPKDLQTVRFGIQIDKAAMKLLKANGDLNGAHELTPEELRQRRAELLETYYAEVRQSVENCLPALNEALTSEQILRLQQIGMQAYGSWDLVGDPEMVKTLGITDEQQARINAVNQKYRHKEVALFAKDPPYQSYTIPFFESVQIQRERDQSALGCLSAEQLEKYGNLVGKPFNVAMLSISESWLSAERNPMGPSGRRGSEHPGFLRAVDHGGIFELLANPAAQWELQLSEATLKNIDAIQGEFAAAWKDAGGTVRTRTVRQPDGQLRVVQIPVVPGFENSANRGQSDDEFIEELLKLRERWTALSAKYEQRIQESLTPQQYERLRQLDLQQSGTERIVRPDVIQALSVTSEQQEKIATAMKVYWTEERKLLAKGVDDDVRAKMGQALWNRDRKISGAMTSDQVVNFESLKGKPFQFVELSQPALYRRFGIDLLGGIFSLTRSAAVLNELQLSDESQVQVEALKNQWYVDWAKAGGEFHYRTVRIRTFTITQFYEPAMPPWGIREHSDGSAEDADQSIANMRETWYQTLAKFDAPLKQALTPEQFLRLKQITWQAMRMSAYSDPEVVAALAVTKEQQTELTTMIDEYKKSSEGLLAQSAPGNEGPAARVEKLQEFKDKLLDLTSAAQAKIDQILTPARRDQFTAMKGKPFDVEQLVDPYQPTPPRRRRR